MSGQIDYDCWEDFYIANRENLKDSYGELLQIEELKTEESEGKRLHFVQKAMGMKLLIFADIMKGHTTYQLRILSIQPSLLESDQ